MINMAERKINCDETESSDEEDIQFLKYVNRSPLRLIIASDAAKSSMKSTTAAERKAEIHNPRLQQSIRKPVRVKHNLGTKFKEIQPRVVINRINTQPQQLITTGICKTGKISCKKRLSIKLQRLEEVPMSAVEAPSSKTATSVSSTGNNRSTYSSKHKQNNSVANFQVGNRLNLSSNKHSPSASIPSVVVEKLHLGRQSSLLVSKDKSEPLQNVSSLDRSWKSTSSRNPIFAEVQVEEELRLHVSTDKLKKKPNHLTNRFYTSSEANGQRQDIHDVNANVPQSLVPKISNIESINTSTSMSINRNGWNYSTPFASSNIGGEKLVAMIGVGHKSLLNNPIDLQTKSKNSNSNYDEVISSEQLSDQMNQTFGLSNISLTENTNPFVFEHWLTGVLENKPESTPKEISNSIAGYLKVSKEECNSDVEIKGSSKSDLQPVENGSDSEILKNSSDFKATERDSDTEYFENCSKVSELIPVIKPMEMLKINEENYKRNKTNPGVLACLNTTMEDINNKNEVQINDKPEVTTLNALCAVDMVFPQPKNCFKDDPLEIKLKSTSLCKPSGTAIRESAPIDQHAFQKTHSFHERDESKHNTGPGRHHSILKETISEQRCKFKNLTDQKQSEELSIDLVPVRKIVLVELKCCKGHKQNKVKNTSHNPDLPLSSPKRIEEEKGEINSLKEDEEKEDLNLNTPDQAKTFRKSTPGQEQSLLTTSKSTEIPTRSEIKSRKKQGRKKVRKTKKPTVRSLNPAKSKLKKKFVDIYTIEWTCRVYKCRLCELPIFNNQSELVEHLTKKHNVQVHSAFIQEIQDNGRRDLAEGHVQLFKRIFEEC